MADDLESIVPPDVIAEMEAIYGQEYSFSDTRTSGENLKTTKGKAAAVMAASGADFDEIAAILGFGTARIAELAVQRAFADSLDSWDKQSLRALFTTRYEMLFRGALRRSQTKGYFAREAAAGTALKALTEQVKFLGMAAPTEHLVHAPAAAEIRIFIEKITNQQVSTLPEEVDVIESHVVREIEQ